MKIRKEFVLRKIAGEFLLVPVGDTALNFNGLIAVNETGAFLWERLQKETTVEELTEYLCAECEVEEETARRDIEGFVDNLRDARIIA